NIERGDGDRRVTTGREQDRALAGEGAEPRLAARGEGEALRGRVEMGDDVGEAEAVGGMGEDEVDGRPVDPSIELELERAIARLLATTFEMESAVAATQA